MGSVLVWRRVAIAISGFLFLLLLIYFVRGVETEILDDVARDTSDGQFILLEDGLTHYYLEGPDYGPLVVFIHGFSVPSYVWEQNTRALNTEGYRTLRYDLYGRGLSDRPDVDYNHQLFIRQLEGLISALSLHQPQVVVGLSMGGPIAASYLSQNPEEVIGLILIAPEIKQTTEKDIFPLNLPGVGEYLMTAIMEPYVLPSLQLNDFYEPDRFPEWKERYREQFKFKGTGEALLSTVRNLVDLRPEDIYKEVQELESSVLLIWGEQDQTILLDHVLFLQEIIPDLELIVVEKAGHLVHYENAEDVNLLLLEFLENLDW